jgi:hypothetical protein
MGNTRTDDCWAAQGIAYGFLWGLAIWAMAAVVALRALG